MESHPQGKIKDSFLSIFKLGTIIEEFSFHFSSIINSLFLSSCADNLKLSCHMYNRLFENLYLSTLNFFVRLKIEIVFKRIYKESFLRDFLDEQVKISETSFENLHSRQGWLARAFSTKFINQIQFHLRVIFSHVSKIYT